MPAHENPLAKLAPEEVDDWGDADYVDTSTTETKQQHQQQVPVTVEEGDGGGIRVTIDIDDDTEYWDGNLGSLVDPVNTAETILTDRDDDVSSEGDNEYSSDKILMALELLVPKTTSHIWMVRETSHPERVVEVFTPNSFEDFLKLAFPEIKAPRSHQWVDFQGLSDGQVRTLGALLFLHELTIEDIIEDCPEKLEDYEESQYQFAVLNGHQQTVGGWEEVKISIIITKGWVITIHEKPFAGLDEVLKRVRRDLFKKTNYKSLRGMWMYYCLFDTIVDSMMRRVARCCESANHVDEVVLQLWDLEGESEVSEATRMIARTRKQVNSLRRYYVSKDNIIKEHKLYRRPHFRDVHDHVLQMLEKLESARDILAQANSNYLAGISVRASITANSTNEAMRKMSLLAFLFVPMTLITSLFGMNVQVPWQNEDSTLPFFMILASFAVFPGLVMLGMYCCSKKCLACHISGSGGSGHTAGGYSSSKKHRGQRSWAATPTPRSPNNR